MITFFGKNIFLNVIFSACFSGGAALHHQKGQATPEDPHAQNHNQMCTMTTWDTGLFTVKGEGDATFVHRECLSRNVANAMFSCV